MQPPQQLSIEQYEKELLRLQTELVYMLREEREASHKLLEQERAVADVKAQLITASTRCSKRQPAE
jgi:hypothetical protein